MINPLKRLFLASLMACAFSGSPLDSRAEEANISGTWEKPGYYCTDPTTSNQVYWGWGYYRIKQTGNNINGTYQNENYPYEYRVSGQIQSNKVILETIRLDKPISESGKTNSWTYRGIFYPEHGKIEVGSSKFRWFNLKRVDKSQVARGK